MNKWFSDPKIMAIDGRVGRRVLVCAGVSALALVTAEVVLGSGWSEFSGSRNHQRKSWADMTANSISQSIRFVNFLAEALA